MFTSPLFLALSSTAMSIILVMGVVLFIKGRPYKNNLLVIHLLLSIALMIFLGIRMANQSLFSQAQGLTLFMSVSVIAGMLLLLLSGFMLMRERGNRILVNLLHLAGSLILISSLVVLVFCA